MLNITALNFVIATITSLSVSEWYTNQRSIGVTLTFLILLAPVYVLSIAIIIGRPRTNRVSSLFFAGLAIMLSIMIIMTWVFGKLASLLIV